MEQFIAKHNIILTFIWLFQSGTHSKPPWSVMRISQMMLTKMAPVKWPRAHSSDTFHGLWALYLFSIFCIFCYFWYGLNLSMLLNCFNTCFSWFGWWFGYVSLLEWFCSASIYPSHDPGLVWLSPHLRSIYFRNKTINVLFIFRSSRNFEIT